MIKKKKQSQPALTFETKWLWSWIWDQPYRSQTEKITKQNSKKMVKKH